MKRSPGAAFAFGASRQPFRRRRVRRKLGRAGLRARLPSRFQRHRGGRPIGPARPHRARPRAVQGEIHHRRRRRPAEGDAGDHPDQAQERRQSALQPHQRAGFQLLFRLPQRSGHRRLRRRCRQRVRLGRVRKRPVRLHRPLVLERAAYDRADGRGPGRASGARDDRRPAGDPRRGDRGSLRDAARTRMPTSSRRACGSARSSPIRTASSISTRSRASTATSSSGRSAARACSPRCASSPSTRSTSTTAWRRSNGSACAGPAATILPRAACPTRHRRRRLRPGRVSGDPAAADGQGRSAGRLATGGGRGRTRRSTRSAAPRAISRPCR